jgi:hypothetical protein
MGDVQKLYSLYQEKRSSFFVSIDKDTNKTIVEKSYHAALVADLTIKSFECFVSNLTKHQEYIKRETEKLQKNDKDLIDSVKTSYDLAQSISDKDLRDNILNMNDAILHYEKQSRDSVPLLLETQILVITSSLYLSTKALISIFESEDPEFVRAGLIRLLLNIIGLFPGGNLLNLLKDINDTISAPKQSLDAANHFLNTLDQFIKFGYSWSTSVQMIIDLIDQLDSFDSELKKPNYEDAVIRVTKRFDEIFNSYKTPRS